jgi:hypothetical protein
MDDDTEHILPHDNNCRRGLESKDARPHPLDEQDAPPVTREPIIHHGHLHRKTEKPGQMAAITNNHANHHTGIA